MAYDAGTHTIFYHRYHIVWVTKYRFKVLTGELRLRIREIIRQVCAELGVGVPLMAHIDDARGPEDRIGGGGDRRQVVVAGVKQHG